MSKQQHFKLSIIAVATASLFPAVAAQAQEDIQALINPDKSEVAVKAFSVDKLNPLYRQYSGFQNKGVNGSLDVDVIRRDESGTWFKLNARDLGLSTVEFGATYSKQGDWSLGIDYNQIPRYAPYQVTTAVSGIGTKTLQQPAVTISNGVPVSPPTSQVSLKTERDITTLTASKILSETFKINASFRNEEKTGVRMSGMAGASYNGTTVSDIYSRFLFAPEPINQTHQQFEGSLEYTASDLQLSAGYYGSFLKTRNDSLTVLAGGANTGGTAGTNVAVSPQALAPDNSSQQLYVNGAYNFSKDTRANFKVAYSEGKQTDNFISGLATNTGIGSNLGGKVETTEAFGAVTSRLTSDLKILASWRYEDLKDKTPVRTYGGPVAYTAFNGNVIVGDDRTNKPESHTTNRAKLEADYRLGAGYSVLAGADYYDKKSDEWERHKIDETTARLAFRKSLSETLNGSVQVARSERRGSGWEDVPAVYAVYLADRNRDRLKAMLDWNAAPGLTFQVAYEGYSDDYKKSYLGLDKGEGQIFSLDGSYALSDTWKLDAWYSVQVGESKQYAQGAVCTNASCSTTSPRYSATINGNSVGFVNAPYVQWDAQLKQRSNQFGIGINGKLSKFDVGGNYLFSRDSNSQNIGLPSTYCTGATYNTTTLLASCTGTAAILAGNGIVPDTRYQQQTIKLFGSYKISKDTKVRFDYIYDYRKMDDYTWNNWVYADGTRVNVKPTQTTQVFGVTLIQSF